MAAFNIAANQRLAQPVSSFMQGKALRLAEQKEQYDREKEAEAADRANRQLAIQEERNLREREAYEREMKRQESDAFAQDPEIEGWLGRIVEGEDSSGYLGYIQKNYPRLYESEEGKRILEDGVVSPEEAQENLERLREAKGQTGEAKVGRYRALPDGRILDTSTGAITGKAQTTEKPGVRDQKINSYQKNYNLDEATATAMADGLIEIKVNDKTGQLVLTDLTDPNNPKVKEIPIDDTEEIPGVGDRGEEDTLYELAEYATGIGSALKATWNDIPILGNMAPQSQTEYARTKMKTSIQSLLKSLAANKRYPTTEMERLRKEVELEPAIFDNPQAMRVRMVAVQDYLMDEVEKNKRVSRNPNQSSDQRKEARAAINDIENYLDKLGLPPVVRSQEEYDALEEGDTFLNSKDNYRPYRK